MSGVMIRKQFVDLLKRIDRRYYKDIQLSFLCLIIYQCINQIDKKVISNALLHDYFNRYLLTFC